MIKEDWFLLSFQSTSGIFGPSVGSTVFIWVASKLIITYSPASIITTCTALQTAALSASIRSATLRTSWRTAMSHTTVVEASIPFTSTFFETPIQFADSSACTTRPSTATLARSTTAPFNASTASLILALNFCGPWFSLQAAAFARWISASALAYFTSSTLTLKAWSGRLGYTTDLAKKTTAASLTSSAGAICTLRIRCRAISRAISRRTISTTDTTATASPLATIACWSRAWISRSHWPVWTMSPSIARAQVSWSITMRALWAPMKILLEISILVIIYIFWAILLFSALIF